MQLLFLYNASVMHNDDDDVFVYNNNDDVFVYKYCIAAVQKVLHLYHSDLRNSCTSKVKKC